MSAVAEGSTESFDDREEVFSRSAVAMGAMSDLLWRQQLRLQGSEFECNDIARGIHCVSRNDGLPAHRFVFKRSLP